MSWDPMARHCLLPVFVALMCAGCGQGSDNKSLGQILNQTAPTPVAAAPEIRSLTLSRSTLEIVVGRSETITVTGNFADGTSRTVNASWTSSNAAIASLDEFGVVQAVSSGVATVTASVGSAVATATVTVSEAAR